jgi:hypothetical protein
VATPAFPKVAGTVFGVIALAHVARIALAVPVVIGQTPVPMAVSWLGALVAGALAAWGWRSAR